MHFYQAKLVSLQEIKQYSKVGILREQKFLSLQSSDHWQANDEFTGRQWFDQRKHPLLKWINVYCCGKSTKLSLLNKGNLHWMSKKCPENVNIWTGIINERIKDQYSWISSDFPFRFSSRCLVEADIPNSHLAATRYSISMDI